MLKFYNTLSRKKEEFTPLHPPVVTMYSCGPTVYNYAHIGNLRTYIFMDLIRRALKAEGYQIRGVLNVTDVGHLLSDADEGEDKMVKASREQQKSPYEIAEFYAKVFFEDLKRLNIEKPEIIAKATDHIPDMIAYVKRLEDAGFGYETSDGIYFDISKFPRYGCLSGADLDNKIAGARVEVNDEKRHPADFALWKKADPRHIMQWESPWGMGYPGWHIECSVMSQKYLGEVFDIHSGGVDHIPIHHENEIAQNEALSKKTSVRFWMHGEFMLVDGGKMSKSLGNTYTVSDLIERGYHPLDFRFFCLNAHYRKKLNFTFEGLDAAKISRARLNQALAAHLASDRTTEASVLDRYREKFREAVRDDLNVPLALGVLFSAIKEPKSKDIYALALEFDKVLGLGLDEVKAVVPNGVPKEEKAVEANAEVLELLRLRTEAKARRDFGEADRLRAEIASKGFKVIDTKDGARLAPIEGE